MSSNLQEPQFPLHGYKLHLLLYSSFVVVSTNSEVMRAYFYDNIMCDFPANHKATLSDVQSEYLHGPVLETRSVIVQPFSTLNFHLSQKRFHYA